MKKSLMDIVGPYISSHSKTSTLTERVWRIEQQKLTDIDKLCQVVVDAVHASSSGPGFSSSSDERAAVEALKKARRYGEI